MEASRNQCRLIDHRRQLDELKLLIELYKGHTAEPKKFNFDFHEVLNREKILTQDHFLYHPGYPIQLYR